MRTWTAVLRVVGEFFSEGLLLKEIGDIWGGEAKKLFLGLRGGCVRLFDIFFSICSIHPFPVFLVVMFVVLCPGE